MILLSVPFYSSRVTPRSGPVKLESSRAFQATLTLSEETILSRVHAKITDFFELAEYDWTTDAVMAAEQDSEASVYLIECMNYLKTVMTSVLGQLPLDVQRVVCVGTWSHIAQRLMVWSTSRFKSAALLLIDVWFQGFFIDREPIKMSDGGLSYLANDIRFAISRATALNIDGLPDVFQELSQVELFECFLSNKALHI